MSPLCTMNRQSAAERMAERRPCTSSRRASPANWRTLTARRSAWRSGGRAPAAGAPAPRTGARSRHTSCVCSGGGGGRYLHSGHDESPVHDEQAERGGAHGGAAAVHQQQARQPRELAHAHVTLAVCVVGGGGGGYLHSGHDESPVHDEQAERGGAHGGAAAVHQQQARQPRELAHAHVTLAVCVVGGGGGRYLHSGHDESPVHDEQAERGGAHGGAAAVHQQQARQPRELAHAHVTLAVCVVGGGGRYLHSGHDESPVHDEQAERGGAHGGAAAVHQQQARQPRELAHAHVTLAVCVVGGGGGGTCIVDTMSPLCTMNRQSAAERMAERRPCTSSRRASPANWRTLTSH
ncbi:unnamed protein product [Arctia plantaginis]|uniref:Uncharacterized protein n=1 Tax=Arctia plantaginis TaxID=874455 RepID=A0A8S0YNW8_ARCPL|nr:unnamed protein product [Arctia plantaginis]